MDVKKVHNDICIMLLSNSKSKFEKQKDYLLKRDILTSEPFCSLSAGLLLHDY